MAVTGLARYQRLVANITNWHEYLLHKNKRHARSLRFTTRPILQRFSVPATLYQVFKEIFMEDFYEIKQLVSKLPEKPVIIDVGANAGFFGILLFSKIKEATVFAYEPMPSNIFLFQETIKANPAMQAIQLHQKAVTGLPITSIELFTADTDSNTVVSSVFSGFNGLNNKKINVPAQSLTSIMEEKNLRQVDLLKLDCEGSEYDIIYNTHPSVLQKINMMVIEVHQLNSEKNNVKALDEYLQLNKYTTRFLPVQEGSFYMEAIKNNVR